MNSACLSHKKKNKKNSTCQIKHKSQGIDPKVTMKNYTISPFFLFGWGRGSVEQRKLLNHLQEA